MLLNTRTAVGIRVKGNKSSSIYRLSAAAVFLLFAQPLSGQSPTRQIRKAAATKREMSDGSLPARSIDGCSCSMDMSMPSISPSLFEKTASGLGPGEGFIGSETERASEGADKPEALIRRCNRGQRQKKTKKKFIARPLPQPPPPNA